MNIRNSINKLIALFILLSCAQYHNKHAQNEKPPIFVYVIIAGNEDFASNLEVNGTVLSNELVDLHPEVSGCLCRFNFGLCFTNHNLCT